MVQNSDTPTTITPGGKRQQLQSSTHTDTQYEKAALARGSYSLKERTMCSVTQGRKESERWREEKGRRLERTNSAEGLDTLGSVAARGIGVQLGRVIICLNAFRTVSMHTNCKNVLKTYGIVMREIALTCTLM